MPVSASLAQRPASAKRAFLRGPLPWLAIYGAGWIYLLLYETGCRRGLVLLISGLLILGFALYSSIVCTVWERIAKR